MIFLLMAAHDTTTITLSMMVYLLGCHPEWQERLRDESRALGRASVDHGDLETLAGMDITLHHLCAWWDVLEACRDRPYFADSALAEVRRFLEDPVAWSAAHGGVASAEEALARKTGSG